MSPFATTRWSMVLSAREKGSPAARSALESLCATYWYPLYAFVRRQGHGAEEAQDLTQEFFTRLIERDFLDSVDREKGRFRSYLLACMRHHLSNARQYGRAAKRGGGVAPLALDYDDAEGRFLQEPSTDLTPERLYERQWALTLLERALLQLREEYRLGGKERLFEALRGMLTTAEEARPIRDLSASLLMSESAVKVAIHRLRKRYREKLRAEIADTVEIEEEIEQEMRGLLEALSG